MSKGHGSLSAGSSGQGIPLVLVGGLMLLLGFVAFRQLSVVSQVGAETARGAEGQVALAMAESGVEELMYRIQTDASDPEQPLYHQLRKQGIPGEQAIANSDRLDLVPKLMAQCQVPDLNLEASSVVVAYQRPFEDLPYERFGLLRYRVRVAAPSPSGGKVVRDLEVGQGFKVVLATVPRPYDQAAVYAGDLWSITDPSDVNRKRTRFLQMVAQMIRGLDKAAALAPASLAAQYAAARGRLPAQAVLEARVPVLPETRPALLIGIGNDGQEYPLDGLDLARKLDSESERVQPLVQKADEALASAVSSAASETAHQAYLSALAAALEGAQSLLSRIWAYGEGYRIVTGGQPDYASIASRHSELGIDHWRRLAGFVLREEQGRTAQAQFDALRQRLGILNGVVLLESPSSFELRGNLPGKLVLVARGGRIILDSVNSGERPQDLLTVVCVGGRVEVRGEVHASLVLSSLARPESSGPPEATVSFSPGATLHGGLVIERLGSGSELRGSLFREAKYYSGMVGAASSAGALTDRYAVLIGPKTVYRKVSNK